MKRLSVKGDGIKLRPGEEYCAGGAMMVAIRPNQRGTAYQLVIGKNGFPITKVRPSGVETASVSYMRDKKVITCEITPSPVHA